MSFSPHSSDVEGAINPLRRRWRANATATLIGVTMSSPAMAQQLAHQGFDAVMIDLEHGAIGPESVHAMIAATVGSPAAPLVRVPANLPWLAKTALDAGAFGVVFPNVEDAAAAEAAVSATRYPPIGDRAWGPFHAALRFGLTVPEYARTANTEIVTVVLLETPRAIEKAAEIVAVPGVDAAAIGTHDLAAAMGHPGQADHPDVVASVERAEAAILASDAVLGGNASSREQAREMHGRGYRFLALGFDWTLLARGAEAVLPAGGG